MQRFGAHGEFELCRLADGAFGGQLRFADDMRAKNVIEALEDNPEILPQALYASGGLLLLKGLSEISADPALMLRLSRLLGPDVENYRDNGTSAHLVHETVPEIYVVSNAPPVNRWPPPPPDPPLCEDGSLPVTFPHRRGWHTDQSFRRPPPDISLLYGVQVAIKGQGQTLFADCTAAFEMLPESVQEQLDGLVGIHSEYGTSRTEYDVINRRPLRPLAKHERPQRQPVVRAHPVTGRRALYLCDGSQMDWVDGPFAGMGTGPGSDGVRLLHELLAHLTQRQFVYVHEWDAGDMVIFDNRNVVHAVTWYDAEHYRRTLWRTTVSGNPGKEYDGERPSWIPGGDD